MMLQSRNDAHLIWGKDRLASEFYGCSFWLELTTHFAFFISEFQHQSCQGRDRSATPSKDKVDLDKVNILQVCTIKSHTLIRCRNGPIWGEKWCLSLARCVWSATRRLCDTGKTVYFVGSLSKDFLTDGFEAGSEAFLILKGLACENIRFSSLFAVGDVSRGGTSATQRQKFRTDDAIQCYIINPVAMGFQTQICPILRVFWSILVKCCVHLPTSSSKTQMLSSREDYILQILTVLSEILLVYIWPLWPFVFFLSFVNKS